jgi:predicted amidohydrolase
VKIAVVQIRAENRGAVENRDRIRHWTFRAAEDGCEAVFFPELSDTGYRLDRVAACAEGVRGRSFAAARSAARDAGVHLFCGLAEKTRSGIYNTLAVFDPRGRLVSRYRKIHLFPAGAIPEDRVFFPGRRPSIARLPRFRFGLLLCYDLRFPGLSAALADHGAEVLVAASAWPASRRRHWRLLLTARAVENQCFVIGVNQAGAYKGVRFAGGSLVADPLGRVVCEMNARAEGIGTADLDRALLESVRERIPVLAARGQTRFQPPRRVRGAAEGRTERRTA